MFGSGVKTGLMGITTFIAPQIIQQVPKMAITKPSAVAVGAARRKGAAYRAAQSTYQQNVQAVADYGWCW